MFKGLVEESIAEVHEFYELNCVCGGGVIGVWLWFGPPNMHGMSCLTFV